MNEDGINIKDRNAFRPMYELQNDAQLGFEVSVRNGQTRLALEYLVRVVSDIRKEMQDLASAIQTLSTPKPTTKSSTTRSKKAEQDVPKEVS